MLGLVPQRGGFYVDWLWFEEVGYRDVFATMLGSQATLFTIAFALGALWLAGHVRLALRTLRDIRPVFTTRDGVQIPLPAIPQLRTLVLAVSTLIAVLVAIYVANQWEIWRAWQHAVPFGEQDPILGYDIGFYVFGLPFYTLVLGVARLFVVLAAIAVAAIYLLSGNLTSGFPPTVSVSTTARRHLLGLAALFFLLTAASTWLGRAEHLIQPATQIWGASYTDVHARIPIGFALTVICLIGAALAIVQATGRRNWPLPVAIGLYLLVSLGGEAYSAAIQRLIVTPNEQARETPYIQHNIDATRRAFGIDTVQERRVSGDATLDADDIAANQATFDNVRLWDHAPLLDAFGQIQLIRTYYDFESVDNDRYMIEGSLRQVMLSPRELNLTSLQNRTWISEHLTYTHGYGLTLGPVNQVTSEGLPVLFVRDLPPESTVPGLQVDEPSIYFGELSSNYVIVRTKHAEFHYPRGDDNVETTYAGRGGVAVGSWLRKLVFAFHFGAYQIFLSDDITAESRILFNRQIDERVRTLAPFLDFDNDPYLVLADGRLFWMYDAYTTSSLYPYSSRSGRVNYIRNSVKLVIDAYHGTTTAYLADETDPIVRTYASIFPSLFKPLSEMPETLRQHVRYPEDIFHLQASMFATYHMTQPGLFFNREDQWEIPNVGDPNDQSSQMQPYYTVMRLPGEQQPEFVQMLPFSPRSRENMAAWLVARSDGEHYGRLQVFAFPKQKTVYGPRQVIARITQDQTISPQITLWNQQGSQVNWGTLMVIPVEESLVYIRPLYLRAAGGRIPELTRVAVAYGDEIVMERTLDDALARLFDDRPAPRPSAPEPEATETTTAAPAVAPPAGSASATLAAEARAHYERAIEAQRAGDWARYGDELRRLGEVLQKMR